MVIQADPVPLRVDEDGAIRIGKSRVTLDVIVAEHKRGSSPQAIADEYDTLELADVYAAIAYYLRHTNEVAVYLDRRQHEAAAMRKKVEDAGMSSPELSKSIQQRWAKMEKSSHASAPD